MATISYDIQMKNQVQWYVMRAYKNEKKAEEALRGEHGLPFFIPKHYILQTCHDKKIKRLVPAIPGLIFVHASRAQLAQFKLRCPYLQYAMWKKSTGLEYLIVPEKEMNNFIKVASHDEDLVTYYQPEEIDFEKGTPIRIIGGTFDGVEGTFIKVKGKRNRRLVVNLQDIAAVSVEVSPDLVEIL